MDEAFVEFAATSACRLLGWNGAIIGPVLFGDVRFWASARLDEREHYRRETIGTEAITDREVLDRELAHRALVSAPGSAPPRIRPPLALDGCLVASRNASEALLQASRLAGYSARGVLLPDRDDVLGLLTDAAVLDQGIVLHGRHGFTLLAQAGPRVPGNGLSAREWELLERVYEAYLGRTLVTTC